VIYETILYEVSERIATITLNRPGHLNAFTVQMFRDLVGAFDEADADDEVRAVIVTGAGRAFCAGADLEAGPRALDHGDPAGPGKAAPRDAGGMVALRIFRSLKPVIAAINGAAVGVGASMTLPMDVRLIAEGAKVGFVFAARGIVPEAASSWFLPRVVGISQALEWCLTARVFPASEALAGGLVRSIHPPGELLAAARGIASEIASNAAPVSAVLTRQMLWRMQSAGHPMQAHRLDSLAVAATGRMADAAEGVRSFLDKRPAVWSLAPTRDLPEWFPWWDEPTYEPSPTTAVPESRRPG